MASWRVCRGTACHSEVKRTASFNWRIARAIPVTTLGVPQSASDGERRCVANPIRSPCVPAPSGSVGVGPHRRRGRHRCRTGPGRSRRRDRRGVADVRQPDAFECIVDSLNEAMLDDAGWPRASALIDEACGARGNFLAFEDGFSADNIRFLFAKTYYRGEDRAAWLKEYYRTYYPVDESLPRWRQLPDSKIGHTADLFSEEERRTSIAYNEAAPRFEYDNGLSVRLDGPGGSRIAWGIANPIDSGGWTTSRVDMVARILPHLRQYVRVRSALVDAGALGASATEFLTTTRTGVIQLDGRGRIVETNDSARALLRRNDGLSDAGEALHATWPDDDERLQALLAGALPHLVGQGVSGSMLVRRESLLPRMALHVMPASSPDAGHRPRRVAALVLIVDPVNRARIEPDLVEAMLGLTPVEAEIAVMLAQGRTVRQIAAATGRGYSTVRTHLKHMFAKLGGSRQFEVAQAVLALSNLPRTRP